MSRTVGIIAEYNPFHNGHAYQIRKAKELSGADYCVAVMSGDFVQRGAPAIYDKYTRTRMALLGGADLVIEMPPVFAASSAEDFAACGIAILDRLGVVDTLCFGSECGRIEPLMEIAQILCRNPEEYETILAENLRNGFTFPQARADALARYCRTEEKKTGLSDGPSAALPGRTDGTFSDGYDPETLLSSPNNILGVEYCKALIRRNSSIQPQTILRKGDHYHETALPSDMVFPSAAALRQTLGSPNMDDIRSHFTRITRSVPEPVLPLIQDAVPLLPDDFSAVLNVRLLELQLNRTPLTDFLDVSEDLAARINRQILIFSDFEDRISTLKTKQYTYTRVGRALTHILLGITAEETLRRKSEDYVSCIRILGFRRSAQPLLSAVKKNTKKTAPLPLITKTADAASILDYDALQDFRRDLYCSHLYQSVLAAKSGRKIPNEYTASVVVVP